tara:strand:+ start:114 stop:488 length:375 start_codon:yes stop_codon:yes gene_type:complete
MNNNFIQLTSYDELENEHRKISEMNEDVNELLEKQSKATHFFHLSLQQLLTKMANTTIDVCKEITETIFKKRTFKYQNTFKWWLRYTTIGKDIYKILQKDDRLIYFGLFLVFVSLILNFLSMIH